jgi:hypothetical protein
MKHIERIFAVSAFALCIFGQPADAYEYLIVGSYWDGNIDDPTPHPRPGLPAFKVRFVEQLKTSMACLNFEIVVDARPSAEADDRHVAEIKKPFWRLNVGYVEGSEDYLWFARASDRSHMIEGASEALTIAEDICTEITDDIYDPE